jgi:hypothetical protein
MTEPKLCYVKNCWAYFTTLSLENQTGDNWDDAPYEHQSGEPYPGNAWEIIKVAWDGEFDTPRTHHSNSPWSVDDINAGKIAWMATPNWTGRRIVISAGTTLEEFKKKIKEGGGHVYLSVTTKE